MNLNKFINDLIEIKNKLKDDDAIIVIEMDYKELLVSALHGGHYKETGQPVACIELASSFVQALNLYMKDLNTEVRDDIRDNVDKSKYN